MSASVMENYVAEGIVPSWDYIVEELSHIFRMTAQETEWLRGGITARIIVAIPFAANCEHPERTAIEHLVLYVTEIRGFERYCAHCPSDDADVMSRLSPIAQFEGGKKDVIRHGMVMLALIMLEGYFKSRGEDFSSRKYNPLNSGVWNYDGLKSSLVAELDSLEVPDLDAIFHEVPLVTLDWKK